MLHEVTSLMEGSMIMLQRRSQYNRAKIIMLRRWSCGHGHINEGEWSCYKDGQFNGGSMVMLLR